jgi:hypothetical protein
MKLDGDAGFSAPTLCLANSNLKLDQSTNDISFNQPQLRLFSPPKPSILHICRAAQLLKLRNAWVSLNPLPRLQGTRSGCLLVSTFYHASIRLMALYSFVYRENRVPYYQRLFQRHDGLRQWHKVRPQDGLRV